MASDPPRPSVVISRVLRDALEPRHDGHLPGGQGLAQAVALDLLDLGPGVVAVGDDADLAPGEGGGVDPEVGQGHDQQRHGDPLPGAHEHVVLPGRLGGADGVGQVDQVVGRLAHGADHGDHVGPLAAGPGDVVGHGTDPVGVADGGAPELLDDQWHPDEATDCAPASRAGRRPGRRPGTPAAPRGPRPCGPRPGWAIRSDPGDWVGSRAVPSDKRARQRAAREARLAAEAKQQKRRKQIRNGSSSWWSPASSSAIAFIVSSGNNNTVVLAVQGRQHDDQHDDRRQGRRRQVAGPGQRGGGQGRLPGQHQDPRRTRRSTRRRPP